MQPSENNAQEPWVKRVGWLVLLWAGGVAAIAFIAWLIRVFMNWAGFST